MNCGDLRGFPLSTNTACPDFSGNAGTGYAYAGVYLQSVPYNTWFAILNIVLFSMPSITNLIICNRSCADTN